MAERSPVRLRMHHLMCVHGFKGKGYSPSFVANFWKVISQLGEKVATVLPVDGADDICAPCPNNNRGTCEADETRIRKLDDAYTETLGLKAGVPLGWNEAKELIALTVSDEDFERNCAPCGWKSLGWCRQALRELRETRKRALSALLLLAAAGLLAPASRAQSTDPAVAITASPEPTITATPEPTATPTPTPSPTPVASPTPEPEAAAIEPATMPIDQLEQKLLLDRSRRIPALLKTMTALEKRKFKAALDAAKPLESKPDYADYFHYLSAQAEIGRMKSFSAKRQHASALVAGSQAAYHLTQVLSLNPYTTLRKRASALLGETELMSAEASLKLKKRQKAMQYFENGFQRLAQASLLALVSKAQVVSYALLCEKKPGEMCSSWVVRLAPLVAKTEAARVVEKIAAFKRPFVERAPTTPYRVDMDVQAFQTGFHSYLKGRYEEAFSTWRDLLKSYPRTSIRLRTLFWMGRAAQKARYNVQAETIYREVIHELPFSYYALLASWFGGIDLSRMLDAEIPLASAESTALTPADLFHVRRAETLIASGVSELALLELQDVRPAASIPNEFLVYLTALNHLAGNHLAAFQVLSELQTRSFQGLFSSYGQKLYFPTARLPLIREITKDWKIDALLVLSVIKQESAFNHEAVSASNAYGLMQIIAPTARDLDPKAEVAALFDPSRNIRLGSKYLRMLVNRYSGNIVLALAAYNAGPGRADRWAREASPGLPLEEFIETIGIRETHDYVENILRNFYWYNRRIRGEKAPNLAALAKMVTRAERASGRLHATR